MVSIDPLFALCKSFRAIACRSAVEACGNRGAVSKDLWARGVGASKRSVRSGSVHSDGKGPEASVGPAPLRIEAPGRPRSSDPRRVDTEGPPGSGVRERGHDFLFPSSDGSLRRSRWCSR